MRLEQLTFIRFIAAIAVVIHHFGMSIFPFNNIILYKIFKQGDLGVSFFFFLSGFVMIIAYQNKNKIDFFDYIKNRFARIYPVFLLAAALIFINKIVQGDEYLNIKGLFLHLTMLHAWIPGYQLSYNIASWTLSVEFFFYFLFPFLFNSFYTNKQVKFSRILSFTLIIWIITQIILVLFKPNLFFNFEGIAFLYKEVLRLFPLMHLNQFLVGNLFGLLFLKYGVKAIKNYDIQIIALTSILLLVLILNPDINLFGGLILVVFAPLVYFIACNNGFLTKISNYKFLIFLGEISYGIYILQYPIYYLTKYFYKTYNNNYIGDGLKFYIMIFLLILVSSLSYLYIEKPLREKIKRFRLLNLNKSKINE